ncbi:MAG: adenosylmethionine--8-amino-7-oxononanoate transaminase [Gemmataceae bacterium]|nr:adenosylmethionine--8-amino-7-oxononanoate transaminase [Gemmataceae bacterium]
MSDLLILGTDTDAGKTTFALLCLAAFPERFEYWKPVETGESDSERVRRLVPSAVVHSPLARFQAPVAPPLAARAEGQEIPLAHTLLRARPRPARPDRHVLIETFGGPFSPLNDTELQLALIHALSAPKVLVSSTALGAIGRTLQCLRALEAHGIEVGGVVLVGPHDPYALAELGKHAGRTVRTVEPPVAWDVAGCAEAAARARAVLGYVVEDLDGHDGAQRLPDQYRPWAGPVLGDEPPGAVEIIRRDARAVWHPYTSLREEDAPLVCVGTQDEFLHLADGRRVIDGISSWWTVLHGHRHPPLMAALEETMKSYDHVHFAGVTHPPAVALAELLLRSAWMEGGRVFYSDNGSTAVEVALKMAYQYWCLRDQPQRTLFIGFEHGYHGDTFGAMAVGRDPVFFGRFEPLLFRAEIIPLSAERLKEVLQQHRGEVAAVIVEPLVQGAGGMRMHSLRELEDIARAAEGRTLLVVDEVMTAGGRTGQLWAHHGAVVLPDLVCVAKTLAGGVLPLAATLAAPRIVERWDTDDRGKTFFHGHSFTAHPLACAVALKNWQMLTDAVHPAPARMEAFWNEALAPLRGHRRVRAVRVRGTIAAVEVEVAGGYLADVGRQMRRTCLERGVLLRPLGNVLYALPPFCTSDTSLEQMAAAMIDAVESLG